MTTEELQAYIIIAAAVMGVISQVVANLGHPEWVDRIKPIKTIIDLLAGNYGKAKNAK